MQKKIIWLMVSCLMALSLVLASCGGEEEEEEEVIVPTEEEEVALPTEEEEEAVTAVGGDWWDKLGEPQYGGTFTFRITGDVASFDPWRGGDMTGIRELYLEYLAQQDWALDRNICLTRLFGYPLNIISRVWQKAGNRRITKQLSSISVKGYTGKTSHR